MHHRRLRGGIALSILGLALASSPSGPASAEQLAASRVGQAEFSARVSTVDTATAAPQLKAQGNTVTGRLAALDFDGSFGDAAESVVRTTGEFATINSGHTIYTVDDLGTGATRFSAVLKSQRAVAPSWSFGDQYELLAIPDGRVVVAKNGRFVAGVDKPWAVDAAGEMLRTHYVVDGQTLTQVVETDSHTVFPVVADPTIKRHLGYTVVTFNRTESFTVVGTVASCAAFLSKAKAAIAKALQVGCGTFAAFSATQLAGGKCLRVRVVGVRPLITWFPTFPKC